MDSPFWFIEEELLGSPFRGELSAKLTEGVKQREKPCKRNKFSAITPSDLASLGHHPYPFWPLAISP